VNFMRVYGLNSESGLLICTWPKGNRPKIPFPYCDEIWGGGIEYQVGTHLIYEGLVKEGLAVIKGLRDRYDGEKRNPWNEMECGNHYARSMASWAALLALSGFHYSAPIKMMSFSPRVNADNFSCFFSVDSGWGLFSQKRAGKKLTARLEVAYGTLSLQTLCLNVGARFIAPVAKVNGKSVPCELIRRGKTLLIHFPKILNLKKETLVINLA